MNCLVCGKKMVHDPEDWGALANPMDGVDFEATGNYGSSVWDPNVSQNPPSWIVLHIVICDACLLAKAGDILVVRRRKGQLGQIERTLEAYNLAPYRGEEEP
jgi:hypothetical protein